MIGGILLTGGASRRLGVDKATVDWNGRPLAEHAAEMLARHCAEVVEVGPGWTALVSVQESPAGAGPLAAVAAGIMALAHRGALSAAIVLACDLPNAAPVVAVLSEGADGDVAIPVDADGRRQYTCARYGAGALLRAISLVQEGESSLRGWVDALDPESVHELAGFAPDCFWDLDTPADAARLGIELPR